MAVNMQWTALYIHPVAVQPQRAGAAATVRRTHLRVKLPPPGIQQARVAVQQVLLAVRQAWMAAQQAQEWQTAPVTPL